MPLSFLTSRIKITALPPVIVQLLFALWVTLGAVNGGAWGGIGIGGALLLALAVGVGQRRVPWPQPAVLLFLAAFFASASLSSVYALDPALSWRAVFKMATILLPLSFFFSPLVLDASKESLFRLPTLFFLAFCGLALLAAASLFGILSFGYDDMIFVTKLNRGLSYFLMIGWPMLAAFLVFKRQDRPVRKGKILLFSFVFLLALALNHSRAAQTGFVLSLGVYLVASRLPQVAAGALGAVTALASFWPFLFSWLYTNKLPFVLSLPSSWLARAEIWDYMAYQILERPLLGSGLGNSAEIEILSPHRSLYVFATTPAAHPHNAVTQLWGEMGVLGLLWGLLLAFWALREAWRMPEKLRAAALASYALAFWLTMTAYNFWTDSLWAALAAVCLAFAVLRRGEKELKLL